MTELKQRFHLNQTSAAQLAQLAQERGTDETSFLVGLIGGAFVGNVPCAFHTSNAQQGQKQTPAPAPPAMDKSALAGAANMFKRSSS